MAMLGGSIADTDVLYKNNLYYISCNNKIEVYSQNYRLLHTYSEITRHKIMKLQFRDLSNTQIFILVNKRLILFDIEVQQTVSVLEPKDKDIILSDFVQIGQNIILACKNQNEQCFIVQQELKAEMTQFDIVNPLFDIKSSEILSLSFNQKDNTLIFSIENKLYQLGLKSQKQIVTEFTHRITATSLSMNIVLGFADGQILFFLDMPQGGEFKINKQQCLSLDRHFEAVRSISYNQQLQQLISVQYNSSQLIVWTLKDRHFVHQVYQMKHYIPVRVQHINQAIFTRTSYNNIIIYDFQMKIIGSINKLPAIRSNLVKNLHLVSQDKYIYYNIQNACIFQTNTNIQESNIYNHAGRDLIRAPGSQGADINIISFDVFDNLIISLNKGYDEFLIITQSGKVIFNVYNAIIDGISVKWLNNQYFAIFCQFGFKVYHLQENKLSYCGFKRVNNLINASVIGNIIYLLKEQGGKMAISIFNLDTQQQKQQLYKVPITQQTDIMLNINTANQIFVTTYGEIVIADEKRGFSITIDEENKVGIENEILNTESLLLTQDYRNNQIYALVNNKSVYILQNKQFEQIFTLDIKQQILRFTVMASGIFVFYFQDAKSGYLCTVDEKGQQIQEEEQFDAFTLPITQKISIEKTALNQETQSGEVHTVFKLKFQSNMLSSQLITGRELFDHFSQ